MYAAIVTFDRETKTLRIAQIDRNIGNYLNMSNTVTGTYGLEAVERVPT